MTEKSNLVNLFKREGGSWTENLPAETIDEVHLQSCHRDRICVKVYRLNAVISLMSGSVFDKRVNQGGTTESKHFVPFTRGEVLFCIEIKEERINGTTFTGIEAGSTGKSTACK